MPRNASGTYTLPTGNPVVSGTLIEANWANTTLNDLANEITDSLSRSGEGGMLAPFRLADGLQASPGIAWLNEPSTGFYREGSGEMWGVVGGAQILQYTATGVLVPAGKTLTANGGTTTTTLTTSGAATLASASVTGNLSVGGTLTLTGGLTLNGNVTVGDSSADTLTINSTITSHLLFTDNTYDIGASGATRPRHLYLAGNGVIGGTLGVSGVLTASGGVTGNLTGNVTGNVTGNISGGTVAGTTGTFSSNVTVGGTLGVTGATTLSSTLGVTGAITASGGVSGNVTGNLTGNVTGSISGGTVAGSTGAFSSNVTVGGTLGVTGVATLTANPVLSAGTANGVLYLNGSKEATSGSGLTFDGTNFATTGSATASGGLRSLNANGVSDTDGTRTIVMSANYSASTPGFGTSTNHSVNFITNNTTKATLDTSGNLGIGTSSPGAKLQVNGGVQFGGVGTDGYVQFLRSSDGGAVSSMAFISASTEVKLNNALSGPMTFYTNNTERCRIDASGNLLVGGTSQSGTANRVAVFSANKFGLSVIDTTAQATGVGGALNLGGNYRAAGDAQAFCRVEAAKENSTDNNFAYAMAFSTTANGGSITERARITSSGELLVGGTTAIAGTSGAITIERAGSASLRLFRNDTSVITNNSFGVVGFYGNDTTSNTPTLHAYIEGLSSGTHAAGDNPTDIVFATTPDGTETAAEAGRITQAGSYVLKGGTTTAAAGVGIIFPATQVASADANSLDDYEEGTFTPQIADAATSGNTGTATATGTYTKIGRLVNVTISLVNMNTSGMTAGNQLYIRGLPFVCAAQNCPLSCYVDSINFTDFVTPTVSLSNSYILLSDNIDNAGDVFLLVSSITSGTADIFINGTYFVA